MKPIQHRGIAAVEFAVAAPIILVVAFGVLELTNGIYLQQSVTIGAYEGARVAILPNTDIDNIRVAVEDILERRRVVGGTVSVDPVDTSTVPFGEPISVTVSVPLSQNRIFANHFADNRNFEVTVTLMQER
ncbi:MAG: TadE/TadG family type IV pilus assembly protein [Planctomycetota bacterium]